MGTVPITGNCMVAFEVVCIYSRREGEVASWTSSGARTKPARRQPAVFGPQQGLGNVFLPERQEPPPFHRKRRERSRKRRGLGPVARLLGPRQTQQRRHPRIRRPALQRRPVVQLQMSTTEVFQRLLRVRGLAAQGKPRNHGPRVDVDFQRVRVSSKRFRRHPSYGPRLARHHILIICCAAWKRSGQAEICQFCGTVPTDQHVFWFHVSMDYCRP